MAGDQRPIGGGGVHHTSEHIDIGEHILVCAPHVPFLVRAQRQLLARMVRYLAQQGITQFLDLGSGVPADGHVHQIAQQVNPDARVVYVDIDTSLAGQARQLLADDPNTAYLAADIRQPADVLDAPETQHLLDLREPVAMLLIETLLHLPEGDDPERIVGSYIAALAPGSYLGISHFSQNDDLDMIEPGLLPVPLWRPDTEPIDRNPHLAEVHAGLARKH
ncbi:SAM-dependent methyltransferase [Amycolatopsis pithecellobii]|uniref:SAM-dependent methyltransferase n=1 Tax=Amycolatopsis pithecellobii TaxID=664692 RepID=A0A6N7Z4D8_9PSEU|nr:SAM-dependent methyltransferase [Amycolatopsis pithecellobii]MTD55281.1 hypothetical protein [Amycolatopsis pithecellobii]